MSYTIPEYVDTREQAVLAVASAIKGEAVTGGDGSVNRALDILADVLAQQDVSVPQTNAGAILALAQYVTGGGGGGGSATTDVYLWNTSENESFVGVAFDKVLVQTGIDDVMLPVFEEVAFTPITETFQGMTMQGAKVGDVPCGASIMVAFAVDDDASAHYNTAYGPNGNFEEAIAASLFTNDSYGIALMPVDGSKCVCGVSAQGLN